jgi:RNA polymerase sigma factor (sigma-70 family)
VRTGERAREGDLVAQDATQDEALDEAQNATQDEGQDEAQDEGQDTAQGEGEAESGPDAGVIARVRAGETEAYAELVRAHAPIALRTAALMGAGADAEDVVQDAFVKAYLALGTFRGDAAFRPWLLRIVANETRNAVRSARRQQTAVDREAAMTGAGPAGPAIPESADPAAVALADERRARLMAALEQLSEPQRWVVTYRYLLDLDEAETAAALGWPRGTVKSRLSRALRRLELLLEAEEAVPPGAEPGRTRQTRQTRQTQQTQQIQQTEEQQTLQGGSGDGRGRAARRAAGARARAGGATARRPAGGRPPGGQRVVGGQRGVGERRIVGGQRIGGRGRGVGGQRVVGAEHAVGGEHAVGRRRDDGRAGAGPDRGHAAARPPDPGGAVVAAPARA